MSVSVLKKHEFKPSNGYPTVDGLSDEAEALVKAALWRRIEFHIAYRFSRRNVMWTMLGSGEWSPDMADVFLNESYKWDGSAWLPVTLDITPLGYWIPEGTYMIDARVGQSKDDPVPEDVAEAYRRLAEYMAEAKHVPAGVTSNVEDYGPLKIAVSRTASHAAKALIYSGAADLLRPYRRV